MIYEYIIGKKNNPYYNLAFEETLIDEATEERVIVYLWQNDNTIVNEKTGYTYINISDWAKDLFTYSAQGISAKDYIDSQLYNYSYCIEEISLTTIPIYYLEPNTRIFIYDKKSHIEGEYLIKTLSIPLQYNGLMSISATKAPISLY